MIVCWESGFLPADVATPWNQQCLLTFSWRCYPTAKIHCAWSRGGFVFMWNHLTWRAVLVSLTSQSHFILFLHKPGHDQYLLVCKTGSDWTAEVLCCQKNRSEMKCCCHGLCICFVNKLGTDCYKQFCDVWHVLLANPLWLQGWMQSTTCSDTHPLPHSSTTVFIKLQPTV